MSSLTATETKIQRICDLARLRGSPHILSWAEELEQDSFNNAGEAWTAQHGHLRQLISQGENWDLYVGKLIDQDSDGPARFALAQRALSTWRERSIFLENDFNFTEFTAVFSASFEEESPKNNTSWGPLPGLNIWIPSLHIQKRKNKLYAIRSCLISEETNPEDVPALMQAEPPLFHRDEALNLNPLHVEDFAERADYALELLRFGAMRKVVLARSEDKILQHNINEEKFINALGKLGDERSSVYAMDCSTGVFVGCTPERLFSRSGQQISSMALAGSRARSQDSDEDKRLADELFSSTKERKEHQLVVEHIRKALTGRCKELHFPDSPSLRALPSIQHLETAISGVLNKSTDFDLLAALYPTPAVCGLPVDLAQHYLAKREDFQRGYYCGLLGASTEQHSDFIVPLRGALINKTTARCFSGAGLVETSDPHAEKKETSIKMAGILRLLDEIDQ